MQHHNPIPIQGQREKAVFRTVPIPVFAFDYLKDTQRAIEASGHRITFNEVLARVVKHRTRKGYRSYREMGTVLGIAKSTLGRWMHKHFPKIAANIGGNDGAAPGGLRDAPELPSPADEVVSEVKRIRAIALSLPPGEKRRVSDALQELLADLGKLPVMEDANAF